MLCKEVCDIFDLTNMVVDPTCFTKGASPSLNDVILTNKPNYCMNTNNYNYVLDFDMVFFALLGHVYLQSV
jgi:hypothetical protein